MQENLSLNHFSAKKVTTFLGQPVPWEMTQFEEEFQRAESVGGVFDLSDWGVVSVSGDDALDYLNRMSTVAVKKMQPGEVRHGAFLTGRGIVISLGMLHQIDAKKFHFIVSTGQSARASEHLEQFHFQEKLEVRNENADWAIFGGWGLERILANHAKTLEPLCAFTGSWEGFEFTGWRDDIRPSLIWVKMNRHFAPSFLQALGAHGIALLGRRLFEFYRIRAAVPEVGVEVGEKEILLETNFERAVARNKGCYPGQEVIERIFTYGSVNRKLLPIGIGTKDVFPEVPFELSCEGKSVGNVVSLAVSPQDKRVAVGLAYLHKSVWEYRGIFDSFPQLEVKQPG